MNQNILKSLHQRTELLAKDPNSRFAPLTVVFRDEEIVDALIQLTGLYRDQLDDITRVQEALHAKQHAT